MNGAVKLDSCPFGSKICPASVKEPGAHANRPCIKTGAPIRHQCVFRPQADGGLDFLFFPFFFYFSERRQMSRCAVPSLSGVMADWPFHFLLFKRSTVPPADTSERRHNATPSSHLLSEWMCTVILVQSKSQSFTALKPETGFFFF